MNMDASHLWAKSTRDGEPVHPSMFLPRHLDDVYNAAVQVIDASGEEQLTLQRTIAFYLDGNGAVERR